MDIKYCRRCGKVFNYKVSFYCPACIIENDKDFITCRDYIEKNKFVTIKELADSTGVDEKIILMFLKEGRLSLNTGSGLLCENCGRSIHKGRYCDDCVSTIKKDLNHIKSKMAENKKVSRTDIKYNRSDRMHIAKRIIVDKEREE